MMVNQSTIMEKIISSVKEAINRYNLLEKGDKILLAISGGPDSMALLHIMRMLQAEYELSLCVAHFDHGIREESFRDAEFVESECRKLGLKFVMGKGRVPELKESLGISLEDAARRARYSFLLDMAEKLGMNKIATGHTADDMLETLILRIARGTGLSGLSLIKPKTGKIIRPLILLTREEILKFLSEEEIPYVVDRTNFELKYKRNFVRHKIVPLLKELNPDILKIVAKERDVWEEENNALEDLAQKYYDRYSKEEKGMIILNCKELKSYHTGFLKRVFRCVIKEAKGDLTKIKKEHLDNLVMLLKEKMSGKEIDIPGLKVKKSYDELFFIREEINLEKEKVFEVPGELNFNGYKLKAHFTDERIIGDGKRIAVFDADALSLPLKVRSRQPGDKMMPFGLSEYKKLKEIFIDDKIPLYLRDLLPVVISGEEIIWVPFVRQSNHGKITEKTRRFLVLECEK